MPQPSMRIENRAYQSSAGYILMYMPCGWWQRFREINFLMVSHGVHIQALLPSKSQQMSPSNGVE